MLISEKTVRFNTRAVGAALSARADNTVSLFCGCY